MEFPGIIANPGKQSEARPKQMLHGNHYRMSRLRVREPPRLLFNRLMLRTHEMVVVAKCPLWLQASVTSPWHVPGTGIPSFTGRKSACFTFAGFRV